MKLVSSLDSFAVELFVSAALPRAAGTRNAKLRTKIFFDNDCRIIKPLNLSAIFASFTEVVPSTMPASSTRLFKGEFHKILLNTQVEWPKPESPLTADRARI